MSIEHYELFIMNGLLKSTGASGRERLWDIKRLEKDLFFIFFEDDGGVVSTEPEGV